ncbi:Choline transporter-like protein 3, partial [Camelus dromedarius]
VFIMGYLVAAGATGRLLFGYDSFGNEMLYDLLLFHLSPRHVFFMNSCNLEVKDARLGSTVLCMSSCPEEQLHTLEEVQPFANTSGGYLTPECYSLFASVLINDVDTLHRILSGIMFGRDTIIRFCVFILGRLDQKAAWSPLIPLLFCLPVVCRALWWQYYNHTNDRSTELDPERENMRRLLRFAVVFTVITVRSTLPALAKSPARTLKSK